MTGEANDPLADSELRARLQEVVDERDIRKVLLRYTRGVDRRQWDMVRSCYHPDAIDEHGDFRGTLDEFISMIQVGLTRYESTNHFMGNITIDIDGLTARSEAYTIAFHRLAPRGDKPARDHIVCFRYVDDFEKREGQWRIAHRLCVFDWTRTDPVVPGWEYTELFRRGSKSLDDAVFAPKLAELPYP
ncbi:MAG: nuclear transport factor 2 family protein [Acidimicrobiia bacterium]|nr:nuclear transport factor 2 family protein [Acidimicrobiia bacterium]